MADPFEAKPMVLKELHDAPAASEVSKKRKAGQQSSQSTTKPPPPKYVTSSGRQSTAVMRESPDPADPSSSKRKPERRVKVSCSTCGKSINRKAEDAGRETFSQYDLYSQLWKAMLTASLEQNLYAEIALQTPDEPVKPPESPRLRHHSLPRPALLHE